MPLTGGCLCTVARFELTEPLFDCCYCHCSICRRLTGSFAGAYGSVHREGFAWVRGAERIAVFSPTPLSRRHFCGQCGCYLLTEHQSEPDHLFVSLGALDDPADARPGYHQFVASAPDWATPDDGLPRYPQWPPS